MWKYIVTWVVLTLVQSKDEYGLNSGKFVTHKTPQEKAFDTKVDAETFIKKGKKTPALEEFVLDSIPLVQYNCQHLSLMITAMGCPDNVKCNTATCTRCGKSFSSY